MKLPLVNMSVYIPKYNRLDALMSSLTSAVMLVLILTLALMPPPVFAQADGHIRFITHSLHPFSYQQNDQLTGFSVELVKGMAQISGMQANIELLPFNRAFQNLKTQPQTALFVIAKRPERENDMKWVGPIITSGVYFYQKRNSGLTLKELTDLKRVSKIGVVQGNADHTYLETNEFSNLSTDKSQIQSLKMLNHGRVDVAPMSELVMPFLAKAANIDVNTIEKTPIKLYDSTLYIAFSNDTNDETVAQWQHAFDQLKASGHYQTLYQRYFASQVQ